MSIKFEITAETPEELIQTFAKLALGSTALTPVAVQTAEVAVDPAPLADKPAATRKPRETKPAAGAETQAGSTGETTTETSTATSATAQPEKPNAAQSTATSDKQPTTLNGTAQQSAEPPAKLDFDKEVAPKVLGYVRYKGKPWVEAILNEFGAARASDLNDAQLPELLQTLADRGGPLP